MRYEVKDTVLLKELIDLGLPKENCESIVKVFRDNLEKLKEKKLNSIFKCNFPHISRSMVYYILFTVGALENFDYSIGQVLFAKQLGGISSEETKYVDIKLQYHKYPITPQKEESTQVTFRSSKDKIESLIKGRKRNKFF